jgi:hypothetical protein
MHKNGGVEVSCRKRQILFLDHPGRSFALTWQKLSFSLAIKSGTVCTQVETDHGEAITVSTESGKPYRAENSLVYLLRDGGRGFEQGNAPKDMFLIPREIEEQELWLHWYLGSGNKPARSGASMKERVKRFDLSSRGWTAQVKWRFGFMHPTSRTWVWRDAEYNFVLRYAETTILHRLWRYLSLQFSRIGFLLATAKSMLLDGFFTGGFKAATRAANLEALENTNFTPHYKKSLKRKLQKTVIGASFMQAPWDLSNQAGKILELDSSSLHTAAEKQQLKHKRQKTVSAASYMQAPWDLSNQAGKILELDSSSLHTAAEKQQLKHKRQKTVSAASYMHGLYDYSNDVLKETNLENSILTQDEKDELRRKKRDARQRGLDQQNARREADPLLSALDATWDTLRLTYPQIALTAPGQLWASASPAQAAKQGPIKCLSVQSTLSRAKEPSLFSRLASLERLRDGKSKSVVASFRAALKAYNLGKRDKEAAKVYAKDRYQKRKEAKKVQSPPCQAGSIARFFTTHNEGLEGESDPH